MEAGDFAIVYLTTMLTVVKMECKISNDKPVRSAMTSICNVVDRSLAFDPGGCGFKSR